MSNITQYCTKQKIKFVQVAVQNNLFAYQKVKVVMPDSSVFCNLCCCDIEKSNERVLLVKGWKQFDVIAEIASLDLSLRSVENKYICRNCVAKLKK